MADRMVVVIGSDFGRTNFYNSADGKDHWPIGSFIIMEKNQRRVVGGGVAGADAARVAPVVVGILDRPVAAVPGKELFRARSVGRHRGDGVDGLGGGLAGAQVGALAPARAPTAPSSSPSTPSPRPCRTCSASCS